MFVRKFRPKPKRVELVGLRYQLTNVVKAHEVARGK
jgi:hypothetical protein